ncbi:hypothetical protein DEU56DRAFT_729296 [Suillus clintonianus]|uniref:uncharacterized protein n=1 Tax=Suillus clintonianus TaxID=1904413 RepID=UPI001B87A0A1|nr:uncharacterized protein DEU56DRAFT_729296 [Suillus clintonianus]KAG2149202.1 hypothetical protein DEU56DRAFT_729296 [Suillus clintonianus]
MDAREDLPKISVETEQDWRRLQRNISTAFLDRLDLELESQGTSQDRETFLPHINQVSKASLVQTRCSERCQFLETLFAITRPNLRINGRTTEEPYDDDEEMEPFDEALDRHIWSLSDQRLKWDREIGGRRRTRPTEVEALVQGVYAQHRSVDMDIDATQKSHPPDLDDSQLDHEMEETFVNAVTMSAQLSQSISMQYERANRFTAVSSEVKTLKP